MSHLLIGLLRFNDPFAIAMTLLEAVAGSAAAFHLYLHRQRAARTSLRRTLAFSVILSLTAWLVFRTGLRGSFPDLSLQMPLVWTVPASLLAVLGVGIAAHNQARGRRSARNAMLSGSLAASGLSCMLFTTMAGVVQPFALAYDLSAVLVTTVVASALFSLAFWEATNPERRHPFAAAIGFTSAATMVSCFGSSASILPFEGWMNSLNEPNDLSSAPLAIILATEAGVVLALSLFGSLVDNRAAARGRLETDRLRQLAESTFEAIIIHRDGIVLDGNDVLAELAGLPLSAFVGWPLARLCPESDAAPCFEPTVGRSPHQASISRVEGDTIPVEILSRPISYAGQPAVASALRDVRQRRASEARIRFLAHHDTLTELPNRAFLTETMLQMLSHCGRTGVSLSFLCLDLDGFKLVNDTLGHAAGDKLLCEVAQRIRDNIRISDFVARIGGDEFVVLTSDAPQPTKSAKLARRLVNCLSEPFQIEGKEVRIGTSVGLALYPADGTKPEDLLRRADMALYRAKQEGRGTYCFFKPDMGKAIQQQNELEQALQVALEHNEMAVHYQPLFNGDRTLVCFEALLRWTHPSLGQISPAQFIPLAEKSGLITLLGEWVLHTACAAAVNWPVTCHVAVNISPRQFLRGNLVEVVSRVLADTGLAASRLELEITEGSLVADSHGTRATMEALRVLGVRLVLDDFGTGYSSLSYLHRFSFNKLKVDQSFVQRLESDASARSIVRAITAMCRSLDLQVTAEGVETIEQFELLRSEGCNELQGYLLGKPMPNHDVETFIAQQQQCNLLKNQVRPHPIVA